MGRNILWVVALALLSLPTWAQTDAEKKSEITEIKRSDSYIYAEATLPTATDAKDLAVELLYKEIDSWVENQKKMNGAANIIIKDSQLAQQEIALPRGNMFRAFIYVKKSDIIAAQNTTVIKGESTSATSPLQQVAVVEKPSLPDAVAQVVKVQKFDELKPLITSLKQSGKITEYNLFSALQNPAEYYLIVCNRQQDVIAVLTPDNGGRVNLKTGNPDAVSNYNWHGATIAFKPNK